ncbi:hypothetical protein SKA68_13920, partial [Enterococcus faecium]|uniref:hypothetical protein n=1 Tax=Enterococcus faecium TaxID=1352 RepID=UPI0030A56307
IFGIQFLLAHLITPQIKMLPIRSLFSSRHSSWSIFKATKTLPIQSPFFRNEISLGYATTK